MAIYHLSVQVIGRASGRSATGAAAYRAGELGDVIVDARTDEVHDYSRKKGVLHAEILAPKGAPDWALDRAELWNRVELAEKRKDAQLCRELNIALPHELTSFERLDLIRRYVKKNFVAHGMVADVCLHAPSQDEDNKNFHAHVLLTMRMLEGEGFGKKAREWNAVGMLESWRTNWAREANAALAKAGHDARIDHRSHEARGLDEVPGQHHGPAVAGILRRGEPSEVAQRQAAERAVRESAQLEAQLAIARAQATAANAELAELEAQELAEQALAQAQAKEAARAERQERQRVQAQQAQDAAQQAQAAQDATQAAKAALEAQEAAQEAAKAAQAVETERQRLVALAQVRQEYQKAELALVKAVKVESAAEVAVEQLQEARDLAISGQRQAGKGLFKTAQSFLKAPGWHAAITAYEAALETLTAARAAVSTARQIVVLAWGQLLGLDPAERAKQAARMAPQAPKAAKVAVTPSPSSAPQRALQPAPVPRRVYQGHRDDDDEPRPGPAPGM